MDAQRFAVPIVLKVEGGVEIDGIEAALAFLEAWPASRRGPVYACAVNSCRMAALGSMSAADARRAFESFARITGLLDRSRGPQTGMPAKMPAIVAQATPQVQASA